MVRGSPDYKNRRDCLFNVASSSDGSIAARSRSTERVCKFGTLVAGRCRHGVLTRRPLTKPKNCGQRSVLPTPSSPRRLTRLLLWQQLYLEDPPEVRASRLTQRWGHGFFDQWCPCFTLRISNILRGHTAKFRFPCSRRARYETGTWRSLYWFPPCAGVVGSTSQQVG